MSEAGEPLVVRLPQKEAQKPRTIVALDVPPRRRTWLRSTHKVNDLKGHKPAREEEIMVA